MITNYKISRCHHSLRQEYNTLKEQVGHDKYVPSLQDKPSVRLQFWSRRIYIRHGVKIIRSNDVRGRPPTQHAVQYKSHLSRCHSSGYDRIFYQRNPMQLNINIFFFILQTILSSRY